MSAAEATLEEQEQPDEQKVQLQPLTQAPQENSQPVTVEGHLPESIPYQDHPEVAEQGHVAEAPPAQASPASPAGQQCLLPLQAESHSKTARNLL